MLKRDKVGASAGWSMVLLAMALLALSVVGCGRDSNSPPSVSSVTRDGAKDPPSETMSSSSAEAWNVVGESVQGRPIRVKTLGHGPRRVLLIGGIHGDEAEGSYAVEQLPAAFAEAGIADRVTLTLLQDANPDGRAAGTRANANGVDLNRNFPARNFDPADPVGGGRPLSQPESRVVANIIDRDKPQLVIVMHSWVDREFINYDGPATELAQRFSATSSIPVTESNSFAPTPGSLGSYAGRDLGIPVLTVEFRKGSDPSADWRKVHDALLQAILGR